MCDDLCFECDANNCDNCWLNDDCDYYDDDDYDLVDLINYCMGELDNV